MEATRSSEMFLEKPTRHHIHEDGIFHCDKPRFDNPLNTVQELDSLFAQFVSFLRCRSLLYQFGNNANKTHSVASSPEAKYTDRSFDRSTLTTDLPW
jgi:hypothetical protein